MRQQIAQHWAQAQALEAARNPEGARAQYESILQLDAAQAGAWLRLSRLDQLSDQYRASRLHALSAAKAVVEKNDWKTLPFVTLRLLSFDERNAVRDLIVNADWTSREVLGQSPVLSQHLWLIEEYEQSLRLIDEALRHVRGHHLLSYSRANALRYCGRMDEATAEYEKCLALAPDYAYAHWSLAYHQKADPPGSRVDRIRRAKAQTAPSLERVHLCYALFKELDDAGDTAQAWAELEEGAALMRGSFRFDSAEQVRRIEALLGDAPQPAQSTPAEGRIPVFVIGMPRTGTTLLERILSNHEQVATAGELNDFARSVSWESNHFFAGALQEPSLASFHGLDHAAVGREYLRRTDSLASGRAYLVDKNPANFFNAGLIRRALPQAKFLCLVRDPMDACFSNLKELFSGDAYPYSYALNELADHYAGFDRLRQHWQNVMPEAFHVVRYEELVADPAGVARGVAEFLRVPYAEDSIDITRNTAPVATASSSQVRQAIHGGNVGAWQRYEPSLRPLRERLEAAGYAV
ncbi:MAG TPA: sulfotransferase [Luteimonas sp.]|nr:sulfotransferase [Luteimonas sp.]